MEVYQVVVMIWQEFNEVLLWTLGYGKVTACEFVSSNHYTTGYGTVSVDSTYIVNVSLKITTVFISTSVNVYPNMAAVL